MKENKMTHNSIARDFILPCRKAKTSGPKIIPFPGVSFNPTPPKVRGYSKTDSIQNEIENFLREMGYCE